MKPPTAGRDGGIDMRTDGGVPLVPAWHWESPQPQGNNLRAVWGIAGTTSNTDELYAAGERGTVLIGGSTGWQIQQSTAFDDRTVLALAGQGSGAQALVLAVGTFDLALRQSGGNWGDLNPLLGTGDGALNGIWATPTAGEFFAVGTTGRIFYVKNSGQAWVPEGQGVTSDSLFSVAGVGNGAAVDVYAVGANGRILHRNAGTWAVEANNVVAQQLNAVWLGDGATAGEVFAAGVSGVLMHKKGGNWASETPPTPNEITALWGSGDELYAVGAQGTILRRKAGVWQAEGIGLTTELLSALWGTVHNGQVTVYAVGNLGTIVRKDQGSWEQLSQRATANPLNGVWARSSSEMYAVGSDGLVLSRSGPTDKGGWSQVAASLATSSLNSISGYAAGSGNAEVYAVGADGTILHQSAGSWAAEGVALTSQELTGVWTGADSTWVVGRRGVIGKKLSGVWTSENGPGGMPVTSDLFAVWGSGQGTGLIVFAAGANGLILRRQGTTWTQEASGLTTESILSLFGSGENDLYAFAGHGVTLHRAGGTWQPTQVRQFASGATGVAGALVPGTNEIYAVGTQGVVVHFKSAVWNSETTLTTQPMSAVSAISTTEAIVVGTGGLILHRY